MNKRILYFCSVAAAACLLVWTCSKKSNPAGPDDNGETTATATYHYTRTPTTVIFSIPQSIDTSRHCEDSVLVTEYDTTDAYPSVSWYVLAGNTLTIISAANDTARYSRSGPGSDLPGTWIESGTVENFPVQMVFTDDSVSVTMAISAACYADSEYIRYQWPQDSSYYLLTLNRISCTQLQLYGTVSGETVTLTWNSGGDMTFTSSSSAHGAYTWYRNPLSCPDDQYPDWYYPEFLDPNARQ
jgi:hypothetical protein